MNEVAKVLETREKALWEGKPKYSAWMTSFGIMAIIICGILAALVAFSNFSFFPIMWNYLIIVVLFALILIYGRLSYNVTYYVVTNKRAIIQSGIIGRDFKSLDYDKLQNVSINKGIIGLLFNVGTVQMFSGEMEAVNTGKNGSGTQAKYDKFIYIDNHYDVMKILQTNLSNRKESLYSGKSK